jgi:hypothetical protein
MALARPLQLLRADHGQSVPTSATSTGLKLGRTVCVVADERLPLPPSATTQNLRPASARPPARPRPETPTRSALRCV